MLLPPRFLSSLFVALIALAIPFSMVAYAQEQSGNSDTNTQAKPVRQIEKSLLVRLVRSTLSAVDHANSTGNYTVLRDLAAPSFAARNTAATLAAEFKPLRDSRVDLSPVLVLPIKLSRAPTLDEAGRLDIAGSVPGDPLTVAFWMRFEPVNGVWRLLDFSLNLVETEPEAASEPAPGQAQPKQEATTPASEAATPTTEAARPSTETAQPPAAIDAADPLADESERPATGGVPVPSPKPNVSDQ